MTIMKKIIATLSLVVFIASAQAQQLPLYSNYFFTPYFFNPAMSGLNGQTEVALINRKQWTGVQGAPNTNAIGANGNLADYKFGWSAYAFNDRTDIVNRTGVYGSYAYHIRFSETNTISLGLGAGYMNNAIDQSAIRVEDGFDPLLYTNLMQGGQFDVNFGVRLQLGDFMLGASVPQLTAPRIIYSDNFDGPIQYQLIRHYIVQTQYDFRLQNNRMVLSPYILMRAADQVQAQVDAGLMFDYTEYFFVGAAFRSNYAVTANAGVHLTENLTFGYAYDFSTSDYAYTLGNSHEFMLRWRFGTSKKDKRLENEIKKIKDKQNRQGEDIDKVINERLDEFKDEIRRDNARQLEETKKTIKDEVLTLYDPSNPNANRPTKQTEQPATTTTTTPATTPKTTTTPKTSDNKSTIKGYDNESYPTNVKAGSKGYYVTAGVFGSESNASRLMQNLKNDGVDASMFKDSSNGMFYVFLMKFNTIQQAQQAKDSGLNGQYSGKLWIKIVE